MDDDSLTLSNVREPSLAYAIIPVVTLVVFIAGAVLLFGLDALDGPGQVSLVLSAYATVPLGIGSSWTTVGTIGVGLIGLGTLVGVLPIITAGAIISGPYVGDKKSSLFETTILTAQLANTDIYTDIRAMLGFKIERIKLSQRESTDGIKSLDNRAILARVFWAALQASETASFRSENAED